MKRRSGLDRTVMEDMVPARSASVQPTRRWSQEVKDMLHFNMHMAGMLVVN